MRATLTKLQYLLVTMCMLSCRTPMIRYSWSLPENINRKYDKILIIAATKVEDTLIRRQSEEYIVQSLKGLGYNAVSSMKEFGLEGLAHLNEVETYIKLCNTGIDAVFSLALIDIHHSRVHLQGNVAQFYYNRIWNYRYLVTSDSEPTGAGDTSKKLYYYESMIFDLRTLQPVSFVQSKSFTSHSLKQCFPCYEEKILQHIARKNVFTREKLIP